MAITLSGEQRRQALESLVTVICFVCRLKKEKKQCFCKTCYFALPKGLRNRLYLLFGDGFEEAYWDSVAELRKMGRHLQPAKAKGFSR